MHSPFTGAGDAAHVHAPFGGQGLNLGVQDAVNLGWKLARVIRGTSSDTLLDTYEDERHPVTARVMRNTMAQRALQADDERTSALRETVVDLLALDEPRAHLAAMISGLDIHYGPDARHPMISRRMPDLDVTTAAGPTRIYDLLHHADALLITLDPSAQSGHATGADRVRCIDATYTGTWELPVVGVTDPPTAVLVRPDGYVGWAGTDLDDGLADAMSHWFGPADSVAGQDPTHPRVDEPMAHISPGT